MSKLFYKAFIEDNFSAVGGILPAYLRYPNVTLLQDEAISIGGVHFFGGSMWTDFSGGDQRAMLTAQQQMNDYRYIMTAKGKLLRPGGYRPHA